MSKWPAVTRIALVVDGRIIVHTSDERIINMARTANVETEVKETSDKKSLSTQVSFNFGTAVRNAAEQSDTTISGFITKLVYETLEIPLPEEDKAEAKKQSDKVSLGASVSADIKEMFDDYAESEGKNTSRMLQEILARASGYDLSTEPKVDRGAALRAAHEARKKAATKSNKTIDALKALLMELAPEKAAATLAALEEMED